jgi:uncharacterized protein
MLLDRYFPDGKTPLPAYQPPLWLRHGHISTMFPYGFRKVHDHYQKRERIETPDGDFFDVDYIHKSSEIALLILHGLEGSSRSQYVLGLAEAARETPIDIVSINHRSCSGELNRTTIMYNSGFTTDIKQLIDMLCCRYRLIHVVGYSMGGNMILKLAGNEDLSDQIASITAVSVPVDLTSSSIRLARWYNLPFTLQFLSTLKAKMEAKKKQHPLALAHVDMKSVKTLIDFDHQITGPLHGYEDAWDYYHRASSKPQLHQIKTPTLLINALNDPFLTPECMPNDIAEDHPHFHFLPTAHGGHVGFGRWHSDRYWIDKIILDWISIHDHNIKR